MLTIAIGRTTEALLAWARLRGRPASTWGASKLRTWRLVWPELLAGAPRPAGAIGSVADCMISDSRSRPVVVVTHSDVFVLRVRRRIAEGVLNHNDVQLIWVESEDETRMIALNDRGTPDWWPDGLGGEATAEFQAMRRVLAARDDERARK